MRRLDRIKMPHAKEWRSKIMAETFANVINADWITFRFDETVSTHDSPTPVRRVRYEREENVISVTKLSICQRGKVTHWHLNQRPLWFLRPVYEMFCKQSFHDSWSNGRGMDRHRAFRTICGPQMGTSINQLTIYGLKKELTVCHPMHILCGKKCVEAVVSVVTWIRLNS